MIDLHTHTFFSDGDLIPSELVRRAWVNGYEAIAITDHCDSSNIDFVLPRIIKASKRLNKFWPIKVIPGVEITHAPLQEIGSLIKFARKTGAQIVVVHGETISEPVLPGTNREGIKNRADIIAHPGRLSKADAELAAKNKVCLEITTRRNHCITNIEVIKAAQSAGAKLVLNTDSHCEDDLFTDKKAVSFLRAHKLNQNQIKEIFSNSRSLI